MHICTHIGKDMLWESCGRSTWEGKYIMIFSDGGFRKRKETASAESVVIELIGKEAGFIGEGTKMVNMCTPSFMAEAIALDEAARYAAAKMQKGSNPSILKSIHGIFKAFSVHETGKAIREDHNMCHRN